ncbi:MAG: thioredoxin domain-containing protein [Hyphomonas sp.]|nr:thioredoxin domain-containing protein [Hyphomonas sp.]
MPQESRNILCLACGALNRVPADKSLAAAKCGRCAAGLATPEPVDVTGDQLAALQAKDTGAFLIDVWAPWCGPCRMMAPHYQSAAARMSNEVRFFKLDSDQHQAAAARLQIRGVPTLIGWNEGRRVANQPGAQTGPALDAWIRKTFNLASANN